MKALNEFNLGDIVQELNIDSSSPETLLDSVTSNNTGDRVNRSSNREDGTVSIFAPPSFSGGPMLMFDPRGMFVQKDDTLDAEALINKGKIEEGVRLDKHGWKVHIKLPLALKPIFLKYLLDNRFTVRRTTH